MAEPIGIGRARRILRLAASILGGSILVAIVVAYALTIKLKSYRDPYHANVAAAGFVTKSAQINQVALHYAEGPENGPPLVLLHAQFLDWFSYSRVLPELAKSFHVFVVDYPGHGETKTPADYAMTANQIGVDLGDFIESRIGRPVFITGNSSGGLLTVWLAANRPRSIRAAVLEDPPLFAAEYPRIKQTIAYRAFATSEKATHDHPHDFLLYWVAGNARFFTKQIGPGTPFLLTSAIQTYRDANPGKPVEIGLIKNDTVRMMIRGLDQYDPRFGAAFYDGSWNAGFEHAEALKRIQCPVLLMQANSSRMPDGTLNGAMTQQDAELASSLLKNGKYVRVDASHVVNLDKPELFTKTLKDFFLGNSR